MNNTELLEQVMEVWPRCRKCGMTVSYGFIKNLIFTVRNIYLLKSGKVAVTELKQHYKREHLRKSKPLLHSSGPHSFCSPEDVSRETEKDERGGER